jgi:hypothetical protein
MTAQEPWARRSYFDSLSDLTLLVMLLHGATNEPRDCSGTKNEGTGKPSNNASMPCGV